MRLPLFAALYVFAACLQVCAGPPENPVMLRIGQISAVSAHPGDTVLVTVPVQVSRGYHVNANPAAGEDYIPLEVKFDTTKDVRPGAAVYPKGNKWRLEGTTEDLLVYAGEILVRVPLVVEPAAGGGKQVLAGIVDFQACDNQVCFLPDSRTISVTVDVLERNR